MVEPDRPDPFADGASVVIYYGGATPEDTRTASQIHCIDDEIIEWLEARDLPNNLTNLASAVPPPPPEVPAESRDQWYSQTTIAQTAPADAALTKEALSAAAARL